MAQGKIKLNKNVHKKERHNKKTLGPKKGHKVIAAKKLKTIKEQKLKLHLTKTINQSTEMELAGRAGTAGFKMIKTPAGSAGPSKTKTKEKK